MTHFGPPVASYWGGEAAMWSEQVRPLSFSLGFLLCCPRLLRTGAHTFSPPHVFPHDMLGQVSDKSLDARVWPRACAVAERLWSGKGVRAQLGQGSKAPYAPHRLAKHRCRMAGR